MATVKSRLTRLTNGKAQFISVVGRAASQIPFRILKADRTSSEVPTNKDPNMIDLANLRIQKTNDALPPEVPVSEDAQRLLAVVVHKSADLETVKKAMTEAGLKIDNYSLSEDGQHVFKQEEYAETDKTDIVAESPQVALVVKGFDSYKASTASFADRIAIQNYYYGTDMATRAAASAINTAIYDAGSPEEAMQAVADIVDDFGDYMRGLIEALPVVCFTPNMSKISKAALPLSTESKEEAKETPPPAVPTPTPTPESVAKAEGAADVTTPTTPAANTTPAPATTTPAATPPVPPPTETVVKTDAAPEPTPFEKAFAQFGETLASIKKGQDEQALQLKGLTEKVTEVAKKADETAAKTEEAVKKADATAARMKGAMAAGDNAPEDKPAKGAAPAKTEESVKKGDPFDGGQIIDTAFMKRK